MTGAEWIQLLTSKETEVRARFKAGIESYTDHEHLLADIWEQDQESFWIAEALDVDWGIMVVETDDVHDELQAIASPWFEQVWVACGKLLDEIQ